MPDELRTLARQAKSRDEIQSAIDLINNRRTELLETNEKLARIQERLQNRRAKMDCETLFPTDDDITVEKVMALNWEKIEGDFYKTVSKWFSKFKYVWQSGYVPETKQAAIKVLFLKYEPPEPQIEEVLQFVPHLKEFNSQRAQDIGKVKFIDIMEESLSQYASYSIYIQEDKVIIGSTSHYRFSVVKEFDDIESCLLYVHENLPYEKEKR